MSNTKAAGIKLTLQAQGFNNGLKKAEDEAKKSGSRMGGAFKDALSNGLKAGLDAVKSTFSTIKDTVLSIGGLAGGIGVVELLRGAVTTEHGFRKLAFAIRAGTGAGVDFQQMQKNVQAVALKTGQATEELGATMSQVFKDTGDAKFAQESIETIGTAATGTGEELAVLGAISGTLNQKFGITAKELPEALAMVFSAANKGGASLENLADDFAELGGKARTMGATGTEGLKNMLSIITVSKQESGKFEQAMTALPQIFDAILERGKDWKLKFGIETVDAKGKPLDPYQIIKNIITKTKGDRTKLAELGFGGEGLQTLMGLSKSFNSSLNAQGTNVKEAQASYDEALAKAADATMTWNDIQLNASYEAESTEKRFAIAMEKLKATFSKPEITDAINKLAESLPKLAELVADFVGFAAKNPALAAGGLVGAQFGSAAIGGVAQSLMSSIIAKGGGAAATTIAETAATSAGGSIAKGFLGSLTAGTGLALIGAAIATAFVANAMLSNEEAKDAEKKRAAETGEKYYEGGGGVSGAGNAEGMGGSGQNYEMFRDPATGEETAIPVDSLERERFLSEVLPNGMTRQEMMDTQAAQSFLAPPEDSLLSDPNAFMTPDDTTMASSFAPYSGAFAPPKAQSGGGGKDAGIDAKLLAEMLGAKELRVKVMNPEAIRGTTGPGSPTPGNVARK